MVKIFILILSVSTFASAQIITTSVPKSLKRSDKFLFYLHGGVVTVLGNNAINQSVPEWGPYEYLNILDSLRKRGFNIISENRKEGINDSIYASRIISQLDTLFKARVKPGNIAVVGASAGWNIALQVSSRLKNPKMKFVLMGGCWPDTYREYTNMNLQGHFLSIIETTDPHGTCVKIFECRKQISSYREISLNTGLSHGFIYKGHKEWIDPIVNWFHKK